VPAEDAHVGDRGAGREQLGRAGVAQRVRMAELVAEVLDVARERLVDAQSVVGQQRDQRRPSASAASSGRSGSSRASMPPATPSEGPREPAVHRRTLVARTPSDAPLESRGASVVGKSRSRSAAEVPIMAIGGGRTRGCAPPRSRGQLQAAQ
jgi:hypothetical protein